MCTLIALHRCAPNPSDPYLVVAANRDEYLSRPAEGPALRSWQSKRIVSPLDCEAGGTWWGINEDGVFVALTNRPNANPEPARRSRGLVVLDALTHASADKAADALGSLPDRRYNPFNLFVADAARAFTLVYEEQGVRWDLEPGVHVIGNADPDDESVPKVRRTLERARRLETESGGPLHEGLAQLCSTHDDSADAIGSPCVHAGEYGTRSSTLLELRTRNGILRHASGAPCTVSYEDFSPLLRSLNEPGAGGDRERPRQIDPSIEARKAS